MRITGSIRVRIALALGVVASLTAPTLGEVSAASRAQGWIVSRTGPGPAVLEGRLTAKAGSSETTVALFALKGAGSRRTLDGAFSTTRIDWGADGWAHTYGYGVPSVSCPALACTDPAGTPVSMNFHSNSHPIASTVLIAGWDVADWSVTVSSPGWRVSEWNPSIRVLRAEDGGGRGVRVLRTTSGTFSRAEADGGPYGSFALAALPCDDSGEGGADFTGGIRKSELRCGGFRSGALWHPFRTRWRLAGDVSGTSSRVNVLVVVDYPRS